jgi:hypothetical protein
MAAYQQLCKDRLGHQHQVLDEGEACTGAANTAVLQALAIVQCCIKSHTSQRLQDYGQGNLQCRRCATCSCNVPHLPASKEDMTCCMCGTPPAAEDGYTSAKPGAGCGAAAAAAAVPAAAECWCG